MVAFARTGVLQVHAAKDIEHSVKHAFPSPIYQSGADRFEIDNCAPQLKAMREGKIELHALPLEGDVPSPS
jgi:hypothetical protein